MSAFKYILAIFFAAIYVCFGYFLDRENFLHLTILFGTAFALYFFLLFATKDKKETDTLLWISMLFRLIFIAAVPFLSDDFYRLIWDGKLAVNGFNPYLYIPFGIVQNDVSTHAGLTRELYNHLNTADAYSVHPPVTQLLAALAGWASKYNIAILAIRIPVLIAEFITIKYLRKLLDHLHLPHYHVLWYALNPLVIVGFSGNLHLEGIMLMFVVVGIYQLTINRWAGAAVCWAMAIGTGWIPLLFFPALIKRLGAVKSVWFCLIAVFTLAVTFVPFLNAASIHHVTANFRDYIFPAEFNAGLYHFISWTGIKNSMLVTAVIGLVLIMAIYFYRNNSWETTLKKLFFAYTVYLLIAPAVHPQHIAVLILLSVFVQHYRYAMLWSVLIICSYSVNVMQQQNYLPIAIEYIMVSGWMGVELYRSKKLSD